jgi:hypothetical protein
LEPQGKRNHRSVVHVDNNEVMTEVEKSYRYGRRQKHAISRWVTATWQLLHEKKRNNVRTISPVGSAPHRKHWAHRQPPSEGNNTQRLYIYIIVI